MMFACMLLGQSKPALWAADKVRGFATREIIALPDRPKLTQTMEGYHAMKSHVLVRFGRWREIIDEPMADDPALYVLTTAMQLLSQLGAPYNPRGHSPRRSRPSRHGDQRALRMITGTVDLVREDY